MMNLFILIAVYFISFLDKPEKTAPQLSPRAMEQRAKWKIPTDAMDYPVSPMYLNEVRKAGGKVLHVSRWFNGATIEMDAKTAAKMAEWSFVTSVELTREEKNHAYSPRKHRAKWNNLQTTADDFHWTNEQLATYNLLPLHEAGYEGQGILLAVCDGGFYKANTMTAFRQKTLELGHFDFTDDTYDFYTSTTGIHGTECLSVISGITDDFYGAATQAPYYLMRSEEYDTESPKEMDNLVAALEKADSLGVNIFSVSLGYSWFDNDEWSLPKTALNGKSTRSSLAAQIAARKGILVCVAAGNDGDNSWRTLCSPADADSILTVGAVNTDGNIGSFSSWGPSADGRVKPEVCAVGWNATLISPTQGIIQGNGTSFATPLLAGLAACLWSALPNENAMQIRERIIRSADRYTHPDINQYGYGIPDAWKAYNMDIHADIEQTTKNTVTIQKILHHGQILIIRDNKVYDLMGNTKKAG